MWKLLKHLWYCGDYFSACAQATSDASLANACAQMCIWLSENEYAKFKKE